MLTLKTAVMSNGVRISPTSKPVLLGDFYVSSDTVCWEIRTDRLQFGHLLHLYMPVTSSETGVPGPGNKFSALL